ncbi:MAG: hypothetical protein WA705_21075 [Candidatus Ozemobacteraceae bacterium]
MTTSLALVYLSRGVDGGLASAEAFFEAYRLFPPGCDHDLVIVAKGWEGISGFEELKRLAVAHNACLFELPDDGYDWGAYMRLAPILSQHWLCFLNTHSRPRVNGWLNLLWFRALHNHEIGAAGATASWESHAHVFSFPSSHPHRNTLFWKSLKFLLNLLPLLANAWYFPMFPNPHLRSNAFVIRRDLFTEFISTRQIPRRKIDAFVLENGRKGLSVFLAKRGLKTLVIGADGNSFEAKSWAESGVFRIPGQKNLLVADNQTRFYESADATKRRMLERLAWGRFFTVTS